MARTKLIYMPDWRQISIFYLLEKGYPINEKGLNGCLEDLMTDPNKAEDRFRLLNGLYMVVQTNDPKIIKWSETKIPVDPKNPDSDKICMINLSYVHWTIDERDTTSDFCKILDNNVSKILLRDIKIGFNKTNYHELNGTAVRNEECKVFFFDNMNYLDISLYTYRGVCNGQGIGSVTPVTIRTTIPKHELHHFFRTKTLSAVPCVRRVDDKLRVLFDYSPKIINSLSSSDFESLVVSDNKLSDIYMKCQDTAILPNNALYDVTFVTTAHHWSTMIMDAYRYEKEHCDLPVITSVAYYAGMYSPALSDVIVHGKTMNEAINYVRNLPVKPNKQ